MRLPLALIMMYLSLNSVNAFQAFEGEAVIKMVKPKPASLESLRLLNDLVADGKIVR